MKLLEAVEIARATGKQIKKVRISTIDPDIVFVWKDGALHRVGGKLVYLTDFLLDAEWSVINVSTKEYNFFEAMRMIKRGKVMKCLANNIIYSKQALESSFFLNEIKAKWIEAPEEEINILSVTKESQHVV